MATHPPDSGAWAARQIRNTGGLVAWTSAWVASLALASFGPDVLWDDQIAISLLAIAINVVLGVGMLLANKRFLQSLDELQRTIQLQAMAWSLGAGLVGSLAWTLFARLDLVAFEAGLAHLIAFMALVYMAGCVAGLLRYR
ncbi:MAG TPA: hypothetical protein VI277_04695 [Candidatus Limnocylindria bacterium]